MSRTKIIFIWLCLVQVASANPAVSAWHSKSNGIAVLCSLLIESILVYLFLRRWSPGKNYLFLVIFLLNVVTHFVFFDTGWLFRGLDDHWATVVGIEVVIVMFEGLALSYILRCSGATEVGRSLPRLGSCILVSLPANILSAVLFIPLRVAAHKLLW